MRLHGRAFAVIMRTPGADRELTAGFLLAERVLRSADDLGAIAHCTDRDARANPDGPSSPSENIVNVTLADGSADALDRLIVDRRQVIGNSSCGLCGRATIESTTRRRTADRVRMDDRAHPAPRSAGPAASVPARVRRDGRTPRGRLVRARRRAGGVGRGRRPSQRRRQSHRRHVDGRSASARRFRPLRERPHVVRDCAEGALRRHPDRRVGIGAVEPGDRSRAGERHHARRFRARRRLQRTPMRIAFAADMPAGIPS